jgi:hypothetical protein
MHELGDLFNPLRFLPQLISSPRPAIVPACDRQSGPTRALSPAFPLIARHIGADYRLAVGSGLPAAAYQVTPQQSACRPPHRTAATGGAGLPLWVRCRARSGAWIGLLHAAEDRIRQRFGCEKAAVAIHLGLGAALPRKPLAGRRRGQRRTWPGLRRPAPSAPCRPLSRRGQ